MNVLFVYTLGEALSPTRPIPSTEELQFGISYISSLLKQHGHRTQLVVASRLWPKRSLAMLEDAIRQFQPRVIGFTAVATEYPFVVELARAVRQRHGSTYLLIGGPHASLNPEEVARGDFDAVCIGEGEHPMLDLVTQLDAGREPTGIANLWIKRGAEIEKNAPRPFLQDLDSLPFPDREMWRDWTVPQGRAGAAVLLGRGCPFQCTYCSNHALRRLAPGTYVRFRSPDRIAEELRDIASRSPATQKVYLEVETIGVNQAWALALCERLEALQRELPHPLSFGTNLRITPGAKLEPLLAAMARAGFGFVNIGLESGSERVRREILKRDYSNQDVLDAVKIARTHGLKVAFFNLIGVPGETRADFEETVRMNRLCQPDWHLTSIFHPYPGTALYDVCREQGLLASAPAGGLERRQAVLDLPGFSRREIQHAYVWFDYLIRRGHRPMPKILARTLFVKLATSPSWNRAVRVLRSTPALRWLRESLKR